MNIRHLQIFKMVCEEMNFTKAAEKLYMTQPAVSHVIQALEEEVGCVLFDRIAKRVYLNELGKVFLSKTVQILKIYEELESISIIEEQQVIKIGSSITIANFWLPKILKQFHTIWKKTPVEVIVDSACNIEQLLEQNKIDIAWIEGMVQNRGLISIPFSCYEMVAVCSYEFLSAHIGIHTNITLEQLLTYPLLLREKGSAIRDTLDSTLLLKQKTACPAWTSVNSQALIQATKEGLGITILPEILVEKELEEKRLIKISVEELHLKNQTYLVYHPDKYITKPLKDLIKWVKESATK